MTQTQLDLTLGKLRKAEGMAQASYHSDEHWKLLFRDYGVYVAETGREFTSEDILEYCGSPFGSPNAVGAAMHSLARELKLVKVGYRPAKRPSRHAAVVAVWQLKS